MAAAECASRMETPSPILPGESAKEPVEMSQSHVASASPGKYVLLYRQGQSWNLKGLVH